MIIDDNINVIMSLIGGLMGVIVLCGIIVVLSKLTAKHRVDSSLSIFQKWCVSNGFKHYEQHKDAIKERFNANPSKCFFNARIILGYPFYGYDGPYAEKLSDEYACWVYRTKGQLYGVEKYPAVGWCFEFATNSLPISLTIRANESIFSPFYNFDHVTTESVTFEKLYKVEVLGGKNPLVLLDPNMMELIIRSKAHGIEFSERSITMTFFQEFKNKDMFEWCFNLGKKIAEQVDRNFPMGKYEKK